MGMERNSRLPLSNLRAFGLGLARHWPGHKRGPRGPRVAASAYAGVGVLRASVRRVACARALRVGALCPVAMPAVAWRTGPAAAPNQPGPAWPRVARRLPCVYRSIDVPVEHLSRGAFPSGPAGPAGGAVAIVPRVALS